MTGNEAWPMEGQIAASESAHRDALGALDVARDLVDRIHGWNAEQAVSLVVIERVADAPIQVSAFGDEHLDDGELRPVGRTPAADVIDFWRGGR